MRSPDSGAAETSQLPTARQTFSRHFNLYLCDDFESDRKWTKTEGADVLDLRAKPSGRRNTRVMKIST